MKKYNDYGEYIDHLKEYKVEFDDVRMYSQIESRMAPVRTPRRLVMAGAFTVILIGSLTYLIGSSYQPESGDVLSEYVLQRPAAENNSVINYVFR
ncbi:MAG: hypothetical protein NTZ10_01125 [Candidatus Saganbacteria bacterium]|nr:hypothetical protein [Candidatus Saganbacteria bacterium]